MFDIMALLLALAAFNRTEVLATCQIQLDFDNTRSFEILYKLKQSYFYTKLTPENLVFTGPYRNGKDDGRSLEISTWGAQGDLLPAPGYDPRCSETNDRGPLSFQR